MQPEKFPNIALIHDHPLGWPGGGPVLLQRLFYEYPADKKIYISAFPAIQQHQTDWLDAVYAQNQSIQRGRYGIGRLRLFWGCLPWSGYVNKIRKIFITHNIKVVHAVSHEFLWISSFFAAKALALPFVLSINDHWPSVVNAQLPNFFSELIFKYIACRADVVMGAHEGAGELIYNKYGIRMNGVERDGLTGADVSNRSTAMSKTIVKSETITIGYCGMYRTYKQEFELLQKVIRTYTRKNGKIKLRLFTELSLSDLYDLGWREDEIEYNTWDSYENVNNALRHTNLLFLPMSFEQNKADLMKWGMSNKTAQYLAVGKPILSYGPDYCSNASLLSKYKIGIHVSECNPNALHDAVIKLVSECFQLTYHSESLKCIESRFNLDKSKRELWGLLSSLVNGCKGREHA